MVAITADQIQAENGWTDSDITDTNLEFLIDNAIDYINMVAGLSMGNLTGVAGSKTVTLTASQESMVKALVGLLMRAYLEKGPNINVSAINVTQVSTDPHYRVQMKLFNQGLQYLRGRSMVRA